MSFYSDKYFESYHKREKLMHNVIIIPENINKRIWGINFTFSYELNETKIIDSRNKNSLQDISQET